MDDNDDAMARRATQERLLISKLTREDLEDKYLKNYDENIVLKKHARKQEDRIKKMATKLVRLVNDKKKSANSNGNYTIQASSGKRMRDVDTEEYLAELQKKCSDLEIHNKRLKESLHTCKIQLQTLQSGKNSVGNVYSNVTSRIDTGLPKREQSLVKNIRTISSHGNLSQRSTTTPRFNNTNTNNNNNNNNNYENDRLIQDLEYDNQELRNKIDEYSAYVDTLNEQINNQKRVTDEKVDELSRLKNQVSQSHLVGVQENIDQIRLQRELKDKLNQYTELFSKFTNLSQQHTILKDNHDHLLDEVERYNLQLKQEQQRNVSLKTELKNSSHHSREILELKENIEDMNKENEALKEANQQLLTSAFSMEREREFREKERALKIQIAQLEATLKSDVGEKGNILDRLTAEREQYDRLNNESREMQVKYYEMKQKFDDMNEKMQFLSRESNIDFKEIEEALIIVKERRVNKQSSDDYLGKVDAEKIKIIQRKTVNLEAQLAETIGELDKSRHLLITQVKINDDYKKEVLLIQSKMEENKLEYDAKMLEYAQLLDLRAARIKKLERQLKDIAYGTKQVRINPDNGPLVVHENGGKRRDSFSFVGSPNSNDNQLIANLERGQNIFEIHLTRLVLSEEAIRIFGESDPSTFCTIEFFEHELQTTPKVNGQKPDYNFTSQYVIKVDDFFLHYLQKETTTIELHQAIGSDYETKAACQLSFRDLIDKQVPRIHGSASLTCINSANAGVSFGTLEYWARLIMPFDEAFRLYKERTKTLGYISSNNRAAQQQEQKNNQKKAVSANNMNELNINILRCSRVNTINNKTQPSPYCVYKFYDFKDHDTVIIPSSNFPEFNDHKSFAVPMDMDLDKYLKNDSIEVYVFDDTEADGDMGLYLGMAKIPLIGLTHDKDIKGTFELKRADGTVNGQIDITLYWQFSYLPPSASTFSASGSNQPTSGGKQSHSTVNLLPGEHLDSSRASIAQKAHKIGVKLHQKKPSQSSMKSITPEPMARNSKQPSAANSPRRSPARSPQLTNNQEIAENQLKRASICSESSIGNATLRRRPDNLEELKNDSARSSRDGSIGRPHSPENNTGENQHYNDTIFGDDEAPMRTVSPNDFDSIRSNYQHNLAAVSDEERDRSQAVDEEPIYEEDEDIDEDIEDDIPVNTNNFQDTGKSEDLVVVGPSETENTKQGNDNEVVIEIQSFCFNEQSEVMARDDVKKLFVGMQFLNYDPEDLESKTSMPKPAANQPVFFNFTKRFDIDPERNMDKREELAKMLLSKEQSYFSFAVVAEPEAGDEDCEDIGYAWVNVHDILESNNDFIDKKLDMYDANDENIVIGTMVVTVEMIDCLQSIRNQLNNTRVGLSETYES